jgi:hypothetical protein
VTPEWVSTIALVVTALASAIGLFAIWRTLRVNEEQTKYSVYQLVTSRMSTISRTFLDLPELRPYFYAGKDASDLPAVNPNLDSRVRAMCEMLVDHAEVILERPDVMGELGESYERYFCDLLRSSPALRSYWQERRNWYIPKLQKLFDDTVKEMDTCPDSTVELSVGTLTHTSKDSE